MTREALLQKAREFLRKKKLPNDPHLNQDDPNTDIYDDEILADFCLSELADLQERHDEMLKALCVLAAGLGNHTLAAGPDSSLDLEVVKLALAQLAAQDLEIEKLRKALAEVIEMSDTRQTDGGRVNSMRKVALVALQREGPEGRK